jgi:hypothetical protein
VHRFLYRIYIEKTKAFQYASCHLSTLRDGLAEAELAKPVEPNPTFQPNLVFVKPCFMLNPTRFRSNL